MEESILKCTKKAIGLTDSDTSFDLDVLIHINSALATLNDLGLGPALGVSIESDADEWAILDLPLLQLNTVRSWLYLKVRLAFDPPTTSFLLDAVKEQIAECEWRLNVRREQLAHPIPTVEVTP